MELTKWDYRWLRLAQHVSNWSKDPSTQVGAVIAQGKHLVSLGFNGFPLSCEDKEEWLLDRPTKYKLVTHAEVNAILQAHVPLRDCTLYTYPLYPCAHCASLIAASGIHSVVSLIDCNPSTLERFPAAETEFVLNANGIEYHWEYAE